MNADAARMIRCPVCTGETILKCFLPPGKDATPSPAEGGHAGSSANRREDAGENASEGVLLCPQCYVWYPVVSRVPVMLTFRTLLHDRFAERHAEPLSRLSEYQPPQGVPQRGEESVQQTFTEEWNLTQQDELSFTYTLDDLIALNKKVWLKWLADRPSEIKLVLNVGCGLGRETRALQQVTKADVFGIDLNFGLLRSEDVRRPEPGTHFTIASLFSAPFAPSSFDLVYSQGVIHHTASTAAALKSIAAYVRPGGYLFIWVYGLDDHLVRRGLAGFVARLQFLAESILRPLISRCPQTLRRMIFGALSVVLHPLVKTRVRHKSQWKLANTNHGLRDWLSHQYAHRHSYNEVLEWFEELGFQVVDVQSPAAYRELFGKRIWGVGVTGRRLEKTAAGPAADNA